MNKSLLILLTLFLFYPLLAKDRDRNANTTPRMSETSLSGGFNHSLIIQEGEVYAFGENIYGQLGDGSFISPYVPIKVPGLDHIIAVSAGKRHSMALRADGIVFVWGDNTLGQLGQATGGPVANPIQVPVSNVIDIIAGDDHCLALLADGTIMSWGANNHGQLGHGFLSVSELPASVVDMRGGSPLTGVTLISAGTTHSLAVLDGDLLAWGNNTDFQIGASASTPNRPIPDFVQGVYSGSLKNLENIISLSAGDTHNLAVDVEGKLYTWGRGILGQLGNGGTTVSQYGQNVASKVRTITAGRNHSLYCDSKGILHFFGSNALGQLGGSIISAGPFVPTTMLLNNVSALAAGGDFSLVLLANGQVMGAGDNAHGQLGTPSSAPFYDVFTAFFTKTGKLAQIASQLNSYILKANGTVWTMGDPDAVGFSTTSDVLVHTLIPGLSNIIAIGATNSNAFALDVSGNVWSWGDNSLGIGGTCSFTPSLIPSPVILSLTDIVYIEGSIQGSIYGSHVSAIDVNGDLHMWGYNKKNELGPIPSSSSTSVSCPEIAPVGKVFSTTLGSNNTFALYADNQVRAWGSRSNDGSTASGGPTPRLVSNNKPIKAISANRSIRMALTTDGEVEIWGRSGNAPNFFKVCQTGASFRETNPTIIYESPISSSILQNVKFIETGDDCGFVIQADGVTQGWGRNTYAELNRGYASTSDEDTPAAVNCTAPGHTVSMFHTISVETHALANLTTQWIEGWGINGYGVLGLGFSSSYETPCNISARVADQALAELNVPDMELVVYPNPAQDILQIKVREDLVENFTTLRLIDTSGKIILTRQVQSPEIELRVDQLEEGIYILQLGSLERRILIRH